MTIAPDFLPDGVHPDFADLGFDWFEWNHRGRRRDVGIVFDVPKPPRATVRGDDAIEVERVVLELVKVGAPVPYVGPPLHVWWWALRDVKTGRGIGAPVQTVEYHWFAHDHFKAGWPEPDPAADWFRP